MTTRFNVYVVCPNQTVQARYVHGIKFKNEITYMLGHTLRNPSYTAEYAEHEIYATEEEARKEKKHD